MTPCQRALWTDGSAPYGQRILQSISPYCPGEIACVVSQHIGCWRNQAHFHVKHGLWSGAGGVGPAKLIEDTLNSGDYHGILARHVVPEVR